MKKRLEADLISIAHRILKLKDRAEIDQLQQETLRLYEKLSVLKFVEDNFKGATPTIGHASALFKLDEVYGLDEAELVKPEPGELDKEADQKAAERKEKQEAKKAEQSEDKENESGEGVDTDTDGKQPVAEEEKKEAPEAAATVPAEEESEVADDAKADDAPKQDKENESGEGVNTDTEGKQPVAEDEKKDTPEAKETVPADEENEVAEADIENDTTEEGEPKPEEEEKPEVEEPKETPQVEEPKEEPKSEAKAEEPQTEEPEVKVQVEKPAEDVKAEEASAAAVYEKEHESTPEEEEKAADAEIKTIEPDANTKVEDNKIGFEFAFERPAAPETPAKQKEISFEDFHDYKEPEFVKKGDDAPKPAADASDWRNWEPNKAATPEAPKAPEQPKKEEPVSDWRDWEPSKSNTPEPAAPQAPKAEEKDWRDWEPTPSAPKEEPKPAAAPKAFNDGFVKAISLGLNDRIAFEKNLFGGSSDDLNRVVSQLNTLNTYQEAKDFIDDLVKPDYNNWKGKEEYEERFMVLVEKRFS
ncbi:hypothetical protein FMM05_18170 [Flavobacterium zepuense]|uniref:Uncharacterized protein n=1 Tax=Flavobacterium zepuense TaxID=2593302 RepID=A0A552UWA6_9FLAO|nr:hypothetical protein [Flavobacterium zepuense]TRW22430.1 hypothetical protein FMM05_18170 [Flavobacterium zepuense]